MEQRTGTRREPMSITVSPSERALIHSLAAAHQRTVSDTVRLLAREEAKRLRLGHSEEEPNQHAPPTTNAFTAGSG